MPFHIFGIFEEHIDDIADFYSEPATGIDELSYWNDSFGFIPNVDDHIGIRYLQNHTLHHFAFGEFSGTILV